MQSNFLKTLWAIVPALIVVISFTGSNAQPLRITTAHPMYFERSREDSIRIENTTDSAIHVKATLPPNQYNFTFTQGFGVGSRSFTLGAHSAVVLGITFQATDEPVVTAILRVSNAQALTVFDTITLMGKDSAYQHTPDFEVHGKPPHAISYHDETVRYDLTLKNITKDTIHIQLNWRQNNLKSFLAIPDGFSPITIPPFDSIPFAFIYHGSIRPQFDTGWLAFRSTRIGALQDSVYLIVERGQDYTQDLVATVPTFFETEVGTKACGVMTIASKAKYPVILYSLHRNDEDSIYFPQQPKLPIVFEPGDSIQIPICYIAPSTYGKPLYLSLAGEYRDTNYLSNFLNYSLDGSSWNCIDGIVDSVRFLDVLVGDSVDRIITVRNRTSVDRAITNARMLNEPWEKTIKLVDTLFPTPLPAHGSATFRLRYVPNVSGFTGKNANVLAVSVDSLLDIECNFFFKDAMGWGIDKTDPTVMKLFPGGPQNIVMKSHRKVEWMRYYFRNNLDHDVRLDTVELTRGSEHYQIIEGRPQPFPSTLKPNEYASVVLQLTADTNGFYDSELRFLTSEGSSASVFSIQAIREEGTPQASVHADARPAVSLEIYPNPARATVRLQAGRLRAGEMSVVDLLGHEVYHSAFDGTMNWDLHDQEGAPVAVGRYIVLVKGVDENGAIVKISHPILVEGDGR